MRLLTILALFVVLGCGHRLVVGNDGTIRVVVEGDHIVFDDPILFATDSDEILEASFGLLDKIAETMVEHTEITGATIEGHTDATGSAEHNQELSERRAQSVVAALQQRGVPQPLQAVGKGLSEPLCSEDTDECHQRNRRVEILITR